MDIKLQRMADQWAGTVICFFLTMIQRLSMLLFGSAVVSPPKKILVILFSEMGSLVLAYPMFQRLKEKYPEAKIYLLQFHKNRVKKRGQVCL